MPPQLLPVEQFEAVYTFVCGKPPHRSYNIKVPDTIFLRQSPQGVTVTKVVTCNRNEPFLDERETHTLKELLELTDKWTPGGGHGPAMTEKYVAVARYSNSSIMLTRIQLRRLLAVLIDDGTAHVPAPQPPRPEKSSSTVGKRTPSPKPGDRIASFKRKSSLAPLETMSPSPLLTGIEEAREPGAPMIDPGSVIGCPFAIQRYVRPARDVRFVASFMWADQQMFCESMKSAWSKSMAVLPTPELFESQKEAMRSRNRRVSTTATSATAAGALEGRPHGARDSVPGALGGIRESETGMDSVAEDGGVGGPTIDDRKPAVLKGFVSPKTSFALREKTVGLATFVNRTFGRMLLGLMAEYVVDESGALYLAGVLGCVWQDPRPESSATLRAYSCDLSQLLLEGGEKPWEQHAMATSVIHARWSSPLHSPPPPLGSPGPLTTTIAAHPGGWAGAPESPQGGGRGVTFPSVTGEPSRQGSPPLGMPTTPPAGILRTVGNHGKDSRGQVSRSWDGPLQAQSRPATSHAISGGYGASNAHLAAMLNSQYSESAQWTPTDGAYGPPREVLAAAAASMVKAGSVPSALHGRMVAAATAARLPGGNGALRGHPLVLQLAARLEELRESLAWQFQTAVAAQLSELDSMYAMQRANAERDASIAAMHAYEDRAAEETRKMQIEVEKLRDEVQMLRNSEAAARSRSESDREKYEELMKKFEEERDVASYTQRNLKKELDTVNQKLHNERLEMKAVLSTAASERESLDAQLSDMRANNRGLMRQVGDLQEHVDFLTNRNATLQAAANEHYAEREALFQAGQEIKSLIEYNVPRGKLALRRILFEDLLSEMAEQSIDPEEELSGVQELINMFALMLRKVYKAYTQGTAAAAAEERMIKENVRMHEKEKAVTQKEDSMTQLAWSRFCRETGVTTMGSIASDANPLYQTSGIAQKTRNPSPEVMGSASSRWEGVVGSPRKSLSPRKSADARAMSLFDPAGPPSRTITPSNLGRTNSSDIASDAARARAHMGEGASPGASLVRAGSGQVMAQPILRKSSGQPGRISISRVGSTRAYDQNATAQLAAQLHTYHTHGMPSTTVVELREMILNSPGLYMINGQDILTARSVQHRPVALGEVDNVWIIVDSESKRHPGSKSGSAKFAFQEFCIGLLRLARFAYPQLCLSHGLMALLEQFIIPNSRKARMPRGLITEVPQSVIKAQEKAAQMAEEAAEAERKEKRKAALKTKKSDNMA